MKEPRSHLRTKLRQARRSLSPRQQALASRKLARILKRHPLFLRSSDIAVYIANDGEIDPAELITIARAMGKKIYLPVLHPLRKRQMWFARYDKGAALHNNYFGIPEPRPGSRKRPPYSLDLVIMPLVGFDAKGNRLGMGGGFYDRAFAFRQRKASTQTCSHRPALAGVAHHCQQVDNLAGESWDIPLDIVVTDKAVFHC